MPTTATVKNKNPNVAPTLTSGIVSPEVLHRWERSCKEFFRVKNVTKAEQVEAVLSRIQDLRLADWVEVNEVDLRTLDFAVFMEKLRGEALEKDWDRKIKLAMLASKQGGRPFREWVYELQTRNALLRGREFRFSDEALRDTLEINMDQGLELRARRVVLEKNATLRDWIEAVDTEDRERLATKEMMTREIFRVD